MAVPRNKEITIIGAGATGLSAALFLSQHGFRPRIVEKRGPTTITKALGINPHTLELLQPSGLTDRFLRNGRTLRYWNYWCRDKLVYRNDFGKVKHTYPFMLIQPQCDTEALMAEALAEKSIFVERGPELTALSAEEEKTTMAFARADGSREEITTAGIVIGADGHNSTVRRHIGADFEGWEHHELFRLYDVELDTPLNRDEGHYLFYREGVLLMLHIRDGIWRVGGNVEDVFACLPKGTTAGSVSWETSFTVREKVASSFSSGNVFLLGDAAHIHSPVGAKGMNLCIEDSSLFTQLLIEGREKEFGKLRRPAIRRTVGLLGQLTDKIGGHNFIGNTVRHHLDKASPVFPLLMPRMSRFMLGLR